NFEVRLAKGGTRLNLINEIDIEDYLLQVVPSEMPKSFGLEALKVQAVAARTYAAKDILRNRYAKLGFHILDSTQSQVYNNLDENELATGAVKSTKGLILVHENKPIDAKYYSTSSGFNSNAHNVW
ncbi:MAG: SpoIID/LytB domain-containing protein, partial [Cetobacterium sp.]